jgi:hypothetical protein
MKDIGEVRYYKCGTCGFVISETHCALDQGRWIALNDRFHRYIEDPSSNPQGHQPPYAEQAMMIHLLGRNGILDTDDMIDYASGYGTLSHILKKYFDIHLPMFDPYIQKNGNSEYIDEKELRKYKTVINSAMFEHVLKREDLDHVDALVDHDGNLVIHTVVCETIPKDPNWFYLRPPVHSAFHTNKSMGILMSQWGYDSSIYCPLSKCWVLLKRADRREIEKRINALNKELQTDWFFYKKGFVDYWKGFA